MRAGSIPGVMLGVVLALLSAGALAADDPNSFDGLQQVPAKNVDALYTKPGATLAQYRRIKLLDAYVAFRKNWQRDQNTAGLRVTSSDMEKAKHDLATMFREIFTEELQRNGAYQVVDETGDDVLILRPAIIDLDVTAPDLKTAGRSRTFATAAGSMTLYVELFDGASGEILARVVDRAHARDSGFMTWQTSVGNKSEAQRMIRKWAELGREALDRARAGLPPVAQ